MIISRRFLLKELSVKIILMEALKGKKVAAVIAFRGFRDPEYFIPVEVLKEAGAKVKTVSNKKGTAVGDDGGEASVDMLAGETRVKDFDAVFFVGGPGMGDNLDNQEFQKLARETLESGKVLGAICLAPALLAKAGLLEGKRATVWYDYLDKGAIKILKENGARFVDEDVVVEGRLVTASGPHAAEEFGRKLVDLLTAKR